MRNIPRLVNYTALGWYNNQPRVYRVLARKWVNLYIDCVVCSSCMICAVYCNFRYGADTSPTVLSSVDCSTSSYLVILQCSYDSTPPSSCTNSDDVSVNCCESLTHAQ